MLPFPIRPMLLQAKDNPFDSSDHIFEWKVDGVRCIMYYDKGSVQLQSKTGKDFTKQFPELVNPFVDGLEAIFDGEVTVLTDGKPDFESTMERYLAKPKIVLKLMSSKPAVYIVWDILWYNGKQVSDSPLMTRKELLEHSLESDNTIRKIDWIESDGLAMWDAIKSQDLEGMVAKNKNSRYSIGKRSPAWVKVKNYHEAEVNVFGYSRRDSSVLVGLGSIVQGHAIGMNNVDRIILKELLNKYGEEGKNGVTWLPMGVKATVKYTTLTTKGNMRDCTWIGFQA